MSVRAHEYTFSDSPLLVMQDNVPIAYKYIMHCTAIFIAKCSKPRPITARSIIFIIYAWEVFWLCSVLHDLYCNMQQILLSGVTLCRRVCLVAWSYQHTSACSINALCLQVEDVLLLLHVYIYILHVISSCEGLLFIHNYIILCTLSCTFFLHVVEFSKGVLFAYSCINCFHHYKL